MGQLRVEEFKQKLAARARRYSECVNEVGERAGLRLVTISHIALSHLYALGFFDAIIEHWFKHLPADAVIADLDFELIRMMPAFASDGRGTFHTDYAVIFASSEWPALDDAAPIPRFDMPLFERPVNFMRFGGSMEIKSADADENTPVTHIKLSPAVLPSDLA